MIPTCSACLSVGVYDRSLGQVHFVVAGEGKFSNSSSFRRARIKIIICYGKSIGAAINRCLSNAPQIALSIHTIELTENWLQRKILHSQVRSPATFPSGSE